MRIKIPNLITLPTPEKFLILNAAQRGNINSEPKVVVEVLVPENKKHFDFYRTLAYECKSIQNFVYRENVEFDSPLKPRPIRIDAVFIINKKIYLIDVILSKSNLAQSVRYCNDIVVSCGNIDCIILIVDSTLASKICQSDWDKPIYIVEVNQ